MNGLAMLTWNETKLLCGSGRSMFFSLAFPTLLLVILGSIPGFREPAEVIGGLRAIDLYVPILIAFAMTMLALQAVPTALADLSGEGDPAPDGGHSGRAGPGASGPDADVLSTVDRGGRDAGARRPAGVRGATAAAALRLCARNRSLSPLRCSRSG